jgi:transcriptional regulator with XRE-family HTH domain
VSDRREFAAYLRFRRASLSPSDIGLPAGERRRTPGLRREEVARLANISATYYTFLEQGRPVRPSRAVIDALATALRLSDAERAHFRVLAEAEPWVESNNEAHDLTDGAFQLLDHLEPWPAFVRDSHWGILASNAAAASLYRGFASRPSGELNLLWWVFCDPCAREVYVDWEQQAAGMLAKFRLSSARRAGDPIFAEVLHAVLDASDHARSWWPRHQLGVPTNTVKRFRHPALGEFSLRNIHMTFNEDEDQTIVAFAPVHDSPVDLQRLVDVAS